MGITTLLEEKAGAPRDPGPIGAYRALALSSLGDVLGLRSLLALAHLVGDLLSLLEVPEPAALYGGEVHEEVLAPVVGGYEPVALVLAEPLDRSLGHAFSPTFLSRGPTAGPSLRLAGSVYREAGAGLLARIHPAGLILYAVDAPEPFLSASRIPSKRHRERF